jgi:hypothetical protein
MGLAAISDRLADQLVPAVRARMSRIRFVTAAAVGALACEELADVPPVDGVTAPTIAFEWHVLESFARRRKDRGGFGVPGSAKAANVEQRGERLSAATYLKAPANFGFTAVYKPFAVDSGVLDESLVPAERCAELVRAWEAEQKLDGYADARLGTEGGRLRNKLTDAIRRALLTGRCDVPKGAVVFSQLASTLHPAEAGEGERHLLRQLLLSSEHGERAELAALLARVSDDASDAWLLGAIRPKASPALGRRIDAVVAYERLAKLIDVAFRALRFVSQAQGAQPMTLVQLEDHPVIVQCAAELPSRFRVAVERIVDADADVVIEERLGDFAIPRKPAELAELALEHHFTIQANKAPAGKRPWFEPYRGGWIVRPGFGTDVVPVINAEFVHPVRVWTLGQFVAETA